jgi:hypothetical protein
MSGETYYVLVPRGLLLVWEDKVVNGVYCPFCREEKSMEVFCHNCGTYIVNGVLGTTWIPDKPCNAYWHRVPEGALMVVTKYEEVV